MFLLRENPSEKQGELALNETPRVLGLIACDLDRTAIGTRSRLAEPWRDRTVLAEVVHRLQQVRGIGEVAALVPAAQMDRARALLDDLQIKELSPRPDALGARVRI